MYAEEDMQGIIIGAQYYWITYKDATADRTEPHTNSSNHKNNNIPHYEVHTETP